MDLRPKRLPEILYVLDAAGDPVAEPDVMAWSRWMQTADRRVAFDQVGDVKVSTVFLGMDHGHLLDRRILFETLVIGGPLDGELDRSATHLEAMAGHASMLARVKRGR